MTRLIVDLHFEVDTPDGDHARGTVRSDGQNIFVQSEDLAILAGGRSNGDLTLLARAVADQGLTLSIADGDGPLMRMGAVRARWWHRMATRSKHVRIVRWRAAAALKAVVVTRGGDGVGVPPPTVVPDHLPSAPWHRRRITTTHDPYGGGHPRLYLADTRAAASGRSVMVFPLGSGTTAIGSADDADLRLDGIDPLQAVVERSADDEYEIVGRGTTTHTFVSGQELPRQRLRTGSRIEIGPWRLTYVRDEHADHGRPYGGRIGGELGRQRDQEQPRYQR